MAKIGHEAPLFDNKNPADMTSHADEEQLRIDQEDMSVRRSIPVTEPGDIARPIPAVELTTKESQAVDRLVEQDFVDPKSALFFRTSASKARSIIGHGFSSSAAEEARKVSAQRAEEEKARQAAHLEESLQLLKETDPHKPGDTQAV